MNNEDTSDDTIVPVLFDRDLQVWRHETAARLAAALLVNEINDFGRQVSQLERAVSLTEALENELHHRYRK